MNYRVVASGDSYNDTGMLDEADAGILFRPPNNVVAEFPQYPVTRSYDELQSAFVQAGGFGEKWVPLCIFRRQALRVAI